jgi:hypothetical protein
VTIINIYLNPTLQQVWNLSIQRKENVESWVRISIYYWTRWSHGRMKSQRWAASGVVDAVVGETICRMRDRWSERGKIARRRFSMLYDGRSTLVPSTLRGPRAVVNRPRNYTGVTATRPLNPADSMNPDRIIHPAGSRRSHRTLTSTSRFIAFMSTWRKISFLAASCQRASARVSKCDTLGIKHNRKRISIWFEHLRQHEFISKIYP